MTRTRSNARKISGKQVEPEQEDNENPTENLVNPKTELAGEDRRRERLTLLMADADKKLEQRKLETKQKGAILVSNLERQFKVVKMRYPPEHLTMKWSDYLALLNSGPKTPPIDSAKALEAECEAVVSKTPGRKKRARPRKAAATSKAPHTAEESSEVFSVPQVPKSNHRQVKTVRLALHERQDTSNFITPAIPTRFAKNTVEETPCNSIPELPPCSVIIPKFDLRTPGTASKRLPMPGEIFVSLQGSPMQSVTPERTDKIIPVGNNKAIKIVSMPETGKRYAEPSAEVAEIYKTIMNLRSSVN